MRRRRDVLVDAWEEYMRRRKRDKKGAYDHEVVKGKEGFLRSNVIVEVRGIVLVMRGVF